jgi:hypothetical protein
MSTNLKEVQGRFISAALQDPIAKIIAASKAVTLPKGSASFAKLKARLTVGTQVQIIRHDGFNERSNPERMRKMFSIRSVDRVQSNAVAFAVPGEFEVSWLYWPEKTKGHVLYDGGDTFAVALGDVLDGTWMVYKFV